uniref:Uncharacterized protein n=1 Tax=Arundo donax TaxID=35708 RepID=A0A0A9CP57_ARUDO
MKPPDRPPSGSTFVSGFGGSCSELHHGVNGAPIVPGSAPLLGSACSYLSLMASVATPDSFITSRYLFQRCKYCSCDGGSCSSIFFLGGSCSSIFFLTFNFCH